MVGVVINLILTDNLIRVLYKSFKLYYSGTDSCLSDMYTWIFITWSCWWICGYLHPELQTLLGKTNMQAVQNTRFRSIGDLQKVWYTANLVDTESSGLTHDLANNQRMNRLLKKSSFIFSYFWSSRSAIEMLKKHFQCYSVNWNVKRVVKLAKSW